jgi:hypothetical protein
MEVLLDIIKVASLGMIYLVVCYLVERWLCPPPWRRR